MTRIECDPAASMQATTPPRETRKDLTHRRIRTAAAELFFLHGYERTTIDQIAIAAGVRRSTLYTHFRDKEEILEWIAEDFATRAVAVFVRLPGPVPSRHQVAAWIAELCTFVKAERMPTILFRSLGDTTQAPGVMARIGDRLYTALAGNVSAFRLALQPGPAQADTRAWGNLVLRELCWACLYSVEHDDAPHALAALRTAERLLIAFVRIGARAAHPVPGR